MPVEMVRRLLRRGLLAVALLALAAAPSQIRAVPVLTHAPYVQDLTPTSFAVLWQTDQASTGRVEIDPPVQDQPAAPASLGIHHEVVVAGLQPATAYRYRVVVEGGATSEWSSAATAPSDPASFSFAVLGDTGTASEAQFAIGQWLNRLDPSFVLITGDLVYPAGAAQDFLPKFFLPLQDVMRRRAIYPSLGNHDYGTDEAGPYLGFFRLPQSGSGTERYYSFDYGNAHFVALDSNQSLSPTSPQYRWLTADLAGSSRFWKFAFFHHPPFSSSTHGSSLALREVLTPLFERFGVNVVFNGHDHNYERTIPIGPAGRAVTYVVTGGGGARLYPSGRSDFTAVSQSTYHAVRLLVEGARLSLEAIDATGAVFDRWALDRTAEVVAGGPRVYLPLVRP